MPQSYFNNEQATSQFFKHGYFYPGDLGSINVQGLLVLGGRTTEVINLGGVKLNPGEIDDRAKRQLGVRDCAAFAISGRDGLDELAIAVVPAESFHVDNFRSSMVNPSQWSNIHVFVTNSLPYNPNGKVIRSELSEQFRLEM
jgi:acyl-CoA synthetase (AMP-forming)/AMP-acid ligase II